MQLSPNTMRWLKLLHLICAACWLAGAVALISLHYIRMNELGVGNELYGIDRAAHHIDMVVIVLLGALGCSLTGLAYSSLTKWGFVQHGWIMWKWLLTIVGILSGTFLLGPWETSMGELSAQLGQLAMEDASYSLLRQRHLYLSVAQLTLLLIIFWLSVFKPSSKRKNMFRKR